MMHLVTNIIESDVIIAGLNINQILHLAEQG